MTVGVIKIIEDAKMQLPVTRDVVLLKCS